MELVSLNNKEYIIRYIPKEPNTHLNFSFKGKRNYVHGTDICNTLMNLLKDDLLNVNFDLSFHQMITSNIELVSIKPSEEKLKFICKYINKNNERKILYGIENENDITSRYKYDEEKITSLSILNLLKQEIILKAQSPFSYIEDIVALNKFLLENLFNKENSKWLFTRLQLMHIPFNNIYPLKLILRANFNFKLTKTEIFCNNKSIGFIYFSLINKK